MSTVETTGFKRDQQGAWIFKDPQSQLVYTLDWSEWLPVGDTVSSVTWTIQARSNDPAPLVEESSGVQSGTHTYIELSGGAAKKIYTVTAEILTADGSTDRRNFRVRVENRSA
jgi:hypothetical protein